MLAIIFEVHKLSFFQDSCAILLYTCNLVHRVAPSLTTHRDVHDYNTRNKNKIIISSNKIMDRSFLREGIKLYNKLSVKIKTLNSMQFKIALKEQLLEITPYSFEEFCLQDDLRMALVEDIIFRNPKVTEKLEQMFNNKKCCDTVFLVNEAQFHASSHWITVSNAKLDSIVDTHFENCGDREIKIGPVKHNESFLVLLKYMYGVPINFTQMDKAVMCEVLRLCELYEFNEFSKELKSYFAKFDCIGIESLVVLLNTSKKYCLKELYEKCTIFAYKNTDQLVNHASFVDLQYHVLLDLIKSDWFCTKEVDILRQTLNWHSNNLNLDTADEQDNAKDANNQSVSVESVKNSVEKEEEDFGNMGVYLDETADASTSTIQNEFETQNDSKGSGVVKQFSEKVLKVLLSQIRFDRISSSDLINFLKLEEGQVYQQFVLDSKYFPNADKPRSKYKGELDCNEEIEEEENQNEASDMLEIQSQKVDKNTLNKKDTKDEQRANPNTSTQRETPLCLSINGPQYRKFTFDVKYGNVRHKSNECFSFEGFNLAIFAEYILESYKYHNLYNPYTTSCSSRNNTTRLKRAAAVAAVTTATQNPTTTGVSHYLKLYLQCTSDKPGSWECDTTLAIRGRLNTQSSDWAYPKVLLTEKNNCVMIGKVPWWDELENFKCTQTHAIILNFDVEVTFNEVKFLKYSP